MTKSKSSTSRSSRSNQTVSQPPTPESGTHKAADRRLEKALAQVLTTFEPEDDQIDDALDAVAHDLDLLALLTNESIVYCSQISPSLYRLRNRLRVIRDLRRHERNPSKLPAVVTGGAS